MCKSCTIILFKILEKILVTYKFVARLKKTIEFPLIYSLFLSVQIIEKWIIEKYTSIYNTEVDFKWALNFFNSTLPTDYSNENTLRRLITDQNV